MAALVWPGWPGRVLASHSGASAMAKTKPKCKYGTKTVTKKVEVRGRVRRKKVVKCKPKATHRKATHKKLTRKKAAAKRRVVKRKHR